MARHRSHSTEFKRQVAQEFILARLVALNAERSAEEKRGLIRWLRPDYQRPARWRCRHASR